MDDEHDSSEQPSEDLLPTIESPTPQRGLSDIVDPLKSPRSHPTEIAGYKIVRVIGEGGMGTTFEAVQATPRRRVAVKVVKASKFSATAKKRFGYETEILARLSHPGVAQIYEAGLWTDADGVERPFMAMEFVEGHSLSLYLERTELDTNAKLDLFRRICAAVHYSHQRGVIHRDLKPDNILVRKDGAPKVIDFGVARVTDSDINFVTQQTNVGALIGTLQYMSPEQVDYDTSDLDTRSDVYALGVILYEMLCGAPPYDLHERALHEAVRVIREELPANPSTIHRYLRGDIETITLKAMEKNRNRRYGSAEDLSNDIRRHLENDPIEARPPSVLYRLGKFSRKHRAASIAAVVAVLAITVGCIISVIGWREADRGWAEAEVQREIVLHRNSLLDESVSTLLTGVMKQVKYLGNSADAQRSLLDLARDNVDGLSEGDATSPLRQAQLAQIWMRIARSNISTSGVGYGSFDEADKALENARVLLEGIDTSDPDNASLSRGVERMRLDRLKYVAEVARGRSSTTNDPPKSKEYLEQAAETYRLRAHEASQYASRSDDSVKALDVEMSSHQSLGNVLVDLGQNQAAEVAFTTSLDRANELERLDRDPNRRGRRMRDRAVALYGLAMVNTDRQPDEAQSQIDEAIQIARALVALEPDNVRRPRDLALMLAVRAELNMRAGHAANGIADFRESADLLTTRAVESPREVQSQQDFEDTLRELTTALRAANQAAEARGIVIGSITQLRCVAEAEDRAGRPVWTQILARLEPTD